MVQETQYREDHVTNTQLIGGPKCRAYRNDSFMYAEVNSPFSASYEFLLISLTVLELRS